MLDRYGNTVTGKPVLVLLTFWRNGRHVSAMVTGYLCWDGKTRVPSTTYNKVLANLDVQKGQTYSH